MDRLKQTCPACGKIVSTIKDKQQKFRQERTPQGTPAPRHVSTTYTYACECGHVFTRVVPAK
jgi:hypothetical protein